MKNILSKKTIILGIIGIVLIFTIYQLFFKKEKVEFEFATVTRGNLVQEVSESGQVKKGEEITLSFKNSGRIEKIYVKVGEEVKAGDILAKLDSSDLRIQLQQYQASRDLYQAQLDKLLAGATKEEIQVAQTAVSNAQTFLNAKKQTLSDTKLDANEDLQAAYDDSLNTLDDAYIKISNSYNTADSVYKSYFTAFDQDSLKAKAARDKINTSMSQVKPYLDTAKSTKFASDVDTALSKMKTALDDVTNALTDIREACESPIYKNTVSSTDKTSLDTHRGYINTALTNVVNAQQTISSTKITNTTNTNSAQAAIESAEGSLKATQDNLAELLAPPRQEDVDLYKAQVRQAQSQVNLLQNQMQDTNLKAPVDGEITQVNKKEGELLQSLLQEKFMVLMPSDPFDIETKIYEEDIVKLNLGNPVDITLVAFPNQNFSGKVIEIDPASQLIDGVVYYKIKISFDQLPENLKPGMTADVIIKTASRENVLILEGNAISKKNGTAFVKILNTDGKTTSEKEISLGLQGKDNKFEVVSGLSEGDKVILP